MRLVIISIGVVSALSGCVVMEPVDRYSYQPAARSYFAQPDFDRQSYKEGVVRHSHDADGHTHYGKAATHAHNVKGVSTYLRCQDQHTREDWYRDLGQWYRNPFPPKYIC